MIYNPPIKKMLLTGSSGMLGSNIVLELKDRYHITGLYKSAPNPMLSDQLEFNLLNIEKISGMIKSIKPDIVVHCAALVDVDKCETDYAAAKAINATATKELVSAAGREKRFIYISTDSVFDGQRGNYNESDITLPLNNYAKTKLEGESYVAGLSDNYAIIRTNIFGWNMVKGTSFAEWVFDNLSESCPIKMFRDVIFSPVVANTVAALIDRLSYSDFVGRLNIGSQNAVSKYDFGVRMAKLFSFDSSLITPISVDSFGFKAKRPKNTVLDVSLANRIFGKMPVIDEELKVFYKKRKTKNERIYKDR